MTSKIMFSQEYYVYAEDGTPTLVKYYDLYDRGNPIMQDATLDEINTFLAGDLGFYQDLDPREYRRDSHPTDGTCWCGDPAVGYVTSVDPTDGSTFEMPRCLLCLLGKDDRPATRMGVRNWVDVHPDNTVDLYEGSDTLLVGAPWSAVECMLTHGRMTERPADCPNC